MLTFFRRIRKGLLGEGATSKYLLYAIGEIALVVIGILIALQINNWNERTKIKVEEESILNEIKTNIETNISEAKTDKSGIQESISSTDIILNHLKLDLPYNVSLSYHFRRIFWGRYFNDVNSGYQVLMNTSEIALDNELKFNLTSYFEESVEDVERSMKQLETSLANYVSGYLLYFEIVRNEETDDQRYIPQNYRGLKDDVGFKTSLQYVNWHREVVLNWLIQFLVQSESILEQLQLYMQDNF